MRLAIIDGTNVVMRCAMAMGGDVPGRVLIASENIMRRFAEMTRSQHMIVALDGPNVWRKVAFPDYKKNRTLDTRKWQELLRAKMMASGIKVLSHDRYEADDVIATFATRAATVMQQAVVLSGDSDLGSIIWPPEIRVWRFGLSSKNEDYFTETTLEYLIERYGVRWPSQLVVYKSLVGESGDGVPGVPKVGKVTAKKLLALHDSLEDMQKTGALTATQYDAALAAYRLIKPDNDVPFDTLTPKECILPPLPTPANA